MNTKWEGLWEQDRKGLYAGQVIKKKEIPPYTRIVIRKNKFYEKGCNRPSFVYCFADSDGFKEKCISLEYKESIQEKVNELTDLLIEANYCPMMLPSESQARAQSMMNRAIELVEEITGEEWRFEYLTW